MYIHCQFRPVYRYVHTDAFLFEYGNPLDVCSFLEQEKRLFLDDAIANLPTVGAIVFL